MWINQLVYILTIILDSSLIINVASVYSKDVRLPVQLQRAMAAEAEAAREARAKVRIDWQVKQHEK